LPAIAGTLPCSFHFAHRCPQYPAMCETESFMGIQFLS
jgi:hypothetical protein